MAPRRKRARAAGVLSLLTHVPAVPAAFRYAPILHQADDVLASGSDTPVLLRAFLELLCALASVGTAVALFPVVKRQNEGVILGYVGLRTLDAGIIAIGVIPLLAVVTLRQDLTGTAGTDTAALLTLGIALVEFHNWTRLLGPGLVCGTNTVLMAYLMYRSRLVPRFIPALGLVGGPLVFAFNAALMLGTSEQILSWAAIGVVPIFAWEVTLAFRLIAKGFRAAGIAPEPARPATKELLSPHGAA